MSKIDARTGKGIRVPVLARVLVKVGIAMESPKLEVSLIVLVWAESVAISAQATLALASRMLQYQPASLPLG